MSWALFFSLFRPLCNRQVFLTRKQLRLTKIADNEEEETNNDDDDDDDEVEDDDDDDLCNRRVLPQEKTLLISRIWL